jgi:hypothetical protein
MNRDNTVKKFLTEMVEEILTIDQRKPEMRAPSGFHIQEEELKSAALQSDRGVGFVMK